MANLYSARMPARNGYRLVGGCYRLVAGAGDRRIMSTHHTLTTVAVIAATGLAAAGCGGSSGDKKTESHAAAPLSTAGYVAIVKSAGDKIDTARRAFFHGKSDRASQAGELQQVKAAYDAAIGRLQAVRPPVAGRAIHAQILGGMRKLSSRLGAILSHKPFSAARASDLLYHDSDQLSSVLNQVYTIP
jgi:hypothetical protein